MTGLDSLIADLKAAHARAESAFLRRVRACGAGHARRQLAHPALLRAVSVLCRPHRRRIPPRSRWSSLPRCCQQLHEPDPRPPRRRDRPRDRRASCPWHCPRRAVTVGDRAGGRTITGRVTSMEMVRFTNSGSEAVLYAIRLARHVTGRADVIKVEGRISRRKRDRAGEREALGPRRADRIAGGGSPPKRRQRHACDPVRRRQRSRSVGQ